MEHKTVANIPYANDLLMAYSRKCFAIVQECGSQQADRLKLVVIGLFRCQVFEQLLGPT